MNFLKLSIPQLKQIIELVSAEASEVVESAQNYSKKTNNEELESITWQWYDSVRVTKDKIEWIPEHGMTGTILNIEALKRFNRIYEIMSETENDDVTHNQFFGENINRVINIIKN